MLQQHAMHKKQTALRFVANVLGTTSAVYLFAGLLLYGFASWVVKSFHRDATLHNPIAVPEIALALLNLLLACGALLVAIFFLQSLLPAHCTRLLATKVPAKLWLFVSAFLGAGLLLNMCGALLEKLLSTAIGYTPALVTQLPDSFLALCLSFVTLCVCPAVLEEWLCRGLMQSALQKWGSLFAIVTTSVLFTLLHHNLAQMPVVFALSMLLGFCMAYTQSLCLCMAMHFANNTVAFLFLYVNQKLNGATALGVVAYLVMILCVGTVASIVALIRCGVLRQPCKAWHKRAQVPLMKTVVMAPCFGIMILYLLLRAVMQLF